MHASTVPVGVGWMGYGTIQCQGTFIELPATVSNCQPNPLNSPPLSLPPDADAQISSTDFFDVWDQSANRARAKTGKAMRGKKASSYRLGSTITSSFAHV
ncbi:hypothetical protein ACMFMG_005424 [Clarireedia jacksonii]